MVPRSILISRPNVDFNQLINACDQALGHSVVKGVDSTSKKLSDAERLLSILAAFKDEKAPVKLQPNLLPHASFSVLTVASDLDMLDILECCAGMPFTSGETKARGLVLAYISGTLAQWRDAVVSGCHESRQPQVRQGFNDIHNQFVGIGLQSIWNEYMQKPLREGYALIEYKP